MNRLQEKKLLFGVTGGIAAYKSCEVVRILKKLDVNVQVAMTKAAQKFVSPLTFETLSNQPVLTEMFQENGMVATRHIDVPRETDSFLICPATANFIGKVANGIADDLLSTMVMVARLKKTIICPAMNSDMWANPIVQRNINILKELGVAFVEPEHGSLACNTEGVGRLANIDRIISKVKIELLRTDEFAGKCFLISAGPTEEVLDPVRYITNASSGKMGFALAEAALSRGAEVTLVNGPTQLVAPDDASVCFVRSAEEMKSAILSAYSKSDVVIMSAAVSDYKPASVSSSKIKKSADNISLKLKKNPDILAELGENKGDRLLIGFAVETDNIMTNAAEKLRKKNLDLIVVNDPNVEGAGFNTDTNVVTLINREGIEKSLSLMPKFEVAQAILDEIAILKGLRPKPFEDTIQV